MLNHINEIEVYHSEYLPSGAPGHLVIRTKYALTRNEQLLVAALMNMALNETMQTIELMRLQEKRAGNVNG